MQRKSRAKIMRMSCFRVEGLVTWLADGKSKDEQREGENKFVKK